jgi:hypothetical protein
MTTDYEAKLEIAKFAYKEITKAMELIQNASFYDIGFCWDECMWVDDEFFNYSDLKKFGKENG